MLFPMQDFLFGKWYKHALEPAQKASVDEAKPRVCSKQTDRENHNVNSIADYYKVYNNVNKNKIEIKLGKVLTKTSFSTACFKF